MSRPALFAALLAVLLAAPAARAQSRADFESLPATMNDAGGCPLGDQSARQAWYQRNDDKRTNESGCHAGETSAECLGRQHGFDVKRR